MPATAERRRELSLQRKRRVTESGCWEWTGSVAAATGYGQYRTVDDNLLVHRMAWELYVGPIPQGHQLHHSCENRLCFNPAHLSLLTPGDHMRVHRAVTACPKCGSTRPRIQNWRNGRPNGTKCRDCHNAKT